jgi:transposase
MTEPVLGINIAKLKFNACLIRESGKLRHIVLPNNEAGFEQLTEWLSRQGVERVHACLEATGTYGEALSLFLHQAGHVVSVVMSVICAVMRKLVHLAYGVLKNGKPFDPEWMKRA